MQSFKLFFSTALKTARRRSCGKLEGDCCLKSFKEKHTILYSQDLPKKAIALLSRIEQNTWNIVKITFLRVFSACYLPESRTKDHWTRSPFLELKAIYLSLFGNLTIIERSIKAIFREYFSSLRFDSGKIFMIIFFSRRPSATYCVWKEVTRQDLLSKNRHERTNTYGNEAGRQN